MPSDSRLQADARRHVGVLHSRTASLDDATHAQASLVPGTAGGRRLSSARNQAGGRLYGTKGAAEFSAGIRRQWSLTKLRENLVKIGAKIVRHGRYIVLQMTEVAIPPDLFADILRRTDWLRTTPLPT